MSNSKKNKKGKPNPKTIGIFIIIQFLISFFAFAIIWEALPIKLDRLVETTIVVDKKAYVPLGKQENRLYIFSNSTKYRFHNSTTGDNISNSVLEELIHVGDKLNIVFYSHDGLFGKENRIVSARTDFETYRSLENFIIENDSKDSLATFLIVLSCFVELIFLSVFVIYLVLKIKYNI